MISIRYSRQVAHPAPERKVLASVHDLNSGAKQFHLATILSLGRFYA
jgi:hypothetical protein